MKKTTLLFIMAWAIGFAQAQISYSTIYTDGFETANGFPANFIVKKQTTWNGTATSATGNLPYPSTGTFWKDVYSNGRASSKNYQVAVDLTAVHGGTQCLKFTIPNAAFVDVAPNDSVYTVRWRSLDSKISFNTAAGESTTKYEVTFWAKTDGADKAVLLNGGTPATYLTLTSSWQKFTINRYCTGTGVTALGIDFVPAADGSDYVVYFDDLTVKQRSIAYTSAGTEVSATGFMANWAMVIGASSYSLIVEKSDGLTPATWTAITGSPFTINDVNTLNYAVTGLDAGNYRYRVTATDGTTTTVESNNTTVAVGSTGINDISIKSIAVAGNTIKVETAAAGTIEVFNQIGQRETSLRCNAGLNTITLKNKGVYFVKVGNDTHKVML